MKIVALIPAHNEQSSIGQTIDALLIQTRIPDQIIILADNCTDDTLDIARSRPSPSLAVATSGNTHKKSGALNFGWREYCQDADIVICLDADTVLPPNAVADWEQEMMNDPGLGGSSSKFTMQEPGLLTRIQKSEFSKWTDAGLRRGWTSVLAGTGCAIRNSVLKQVSTEHGPWSYESQTEDFKLTYEIRALGYHCAISPTVRAYTGSMKTVRSLWNQRMKWQVGTLEDLMSIGINKYTALDWWRQFMGFIGLAIKILWIAVVVTALFLHSIHPPVLWPLLLAVFISYDLKAANRIPHRDWKDFLIAGLFIPRELYCWMQTAWFTKAWIDVLIGKVTGKRKDRWTLQYRAEGIEGH